MVKPIKLPPGEAMLRALGALRMARGGIVSTNAIGDAVYQGAARPKHWRAIVSALVGRLIAAGHDVRRHGHAGFSLFYPIRKGEAVRLDWPAHPKNLALCRVVAVWHCVIDGDPPLDLGRLAALDLGFAVPVGWLQRTAAKRLQHGNETT